MICRHFLANPQLHPTMPIWNATKPHKSGNWTLQPDFITANATRPKNTTLFMTDVALARCSRSTTRTLKVVNLTWVYWLPTVCFILTLRKPWKSEEVSSPQTAWPKTIRSLKVGSADAYQPQSNMELCVSYAQLILHQICHKLPASAIKATSFHSLITHASLTHLLLFKILLLNVLQIKFGIKTSAFVLRNFIELMVSAWNVQLSVLSMDPHVYVSLVTSLSPWINLAFHQAANNATRLAPHVQVPLYLNACRALTYQVFSETVNA